MLITKYLLFLVLAAASNARNIPLLAKRDDDCADAVSSSGGLAACSAYYTTAGLCSTSTVTASITPTLTVTPTVYSAVTSTTSTNTDWWPTAYLTVTAAAVTLPTTINLTYRLPSTEAVQTALPAPYDVSCGDSASFTNACLGLGGFTVPTIPLTVTYTATTTTTAFTSTYTAAIMDNDGGPTTTITITPTVYTTDDAVTATWTCFKLRVETGSPVAGQYLGKDWTVVLVESEMDAVPFDYNDQTGAVKLSGTDNQGWTGPEYFQGAFWEWPQALWFQSSDGIQAESEIHPVANYPRMVPIQASLNGYSFSWSADTRAATGWVDEAYYFVLFTTAWPYWDELNPSGYTAYRDTLVAIGF